MRDGICLAAALLALALPAHGVLFTFDDPAELGQWESVTEFQGAQWEVRDGVLRFANAETGVDVWIIRGLRMRDGIVSFRVRFTRAQPFSLASVVWFPAMFKEFSSLWVRIGKPQHLLFPLMSTTSAPEARMRSSIYVLRPPYGGGAMISLGRRR